METSLGTAGVTLFGSGDGLLVLGHGAGGGCDTVDLRAARDGALEVGFRVAWVEQPWRVRGKKVADPPPKLDIAWIEVLATLEGSPLVAGGRSAGARVACRTSAAVGADAVLCLAFPLHPPGRPERSRLEELTAVQVPTLEIQGDRDAFGMPPGAIVIPGADHGFRTAKGSAPAGPQITSAVLGWLPQIRS